MTDRSRARHRRRAAADLGNHAGTSNTVGWFGRTTAAPAGSTTATPTSTRSSTPSSRPSPMTPPRSSFDFTVADPTATSVSFDLVFGSDEYPEWVDQFVDSAIVMVNGVNYALFNHDPLHPLSVVSSNLAAGYFQDNAGNMLPIEYDGVSHVLKIVAPINPGAINHIKIGIADTGDHIYDSGIFLANFSAGNIPGSGVVSPPSTGTAGNDSVTGTSQGRVFRSARRQRYRLRRRRRRHRGGGRRQRHGLWRQRRRQDEGRCRRRLPRWRRGCRYGGVLPATSTTTWSSCRCAEHQAGVRR